MNSKPFVLKYETVAENLTPKMIVVGRFATFKQAIDAQAECEHKSIIHHEPTDLELHDIGNRRAWLDWRGQERPVPDARGEATPR